MHMQGALSSEPLEALYRDYEKTTTLNRHWAVSFSAMVAERDALQVPIVGTLKHKLQATSHKLQATSYKFGYKFYKSQVTSDK